MKRIVPALAALACTAVLATPTQAQSTLSLYGIVDAGVQASWFGAGPQYNLSSGIAEGSRIGFKGTEDLGNGYKAIFTLEARVELDTGQSGNTYLSGFRNQTLTAGLPAPIANSPLLVSELVLPRRIVNTNDGLFDRTAAVGLITPVGAFILGRQYSPGYEVFAMSDAFEVGRAGSWGNAAIGSAGFISPGVAIRYNSALQYRIQLPNGIGASLMYGFDETGSTNFARRAHGANLRYDKHGWNVGIGYNREQDQLGRRSLTTTTVGGSYILGNAKLFAGYHRMENENSYLGPLVSSQLTPVLGPTTAATVGAIVANNARLDAHLYTVGGHYRFGSNRILAQVSRTDDRQQANNDVLLFGLGYDYALSKRTDFYTAVAHIRNSNRAQFALGGAGYTGGSTESPGQDGNALQFGIRHRF